MNATRWVTLTEFVKYLGREGIVHADETEKGWYIAWIDNSPKALARQAAHQAKERSDMDDEQRMRKLIDEQIAKAELEKAERGEGGSGSGGEEAKGLERDEGSAPITLSFGGLKKDPSPPTASASASDPTSAADAPTDSAAPAAPVGISLAPKPNPLKINPLKRPAPSSNPLKSNPLKGASSATAASASKPKAPMSAMQAIMAEEEERKRRRDMQTWSGKGGYGAEGLQVKRQKV